MSAKVTAKITLGRLRRTNNRERANGIAASFLTSFTVLGGKATVLVDAYAWEVNLSEGPPGEKVAAYGRGSHLSDAVLTALVELVG